MDQPGVKAPGTAKKTVWPGSRGRMSVREPEPEQSEEEELTVPEPKISLVEILPGLPSVIVKRSTSGTASPASIGILNGVLRWSAVLELLLQLDKKA